MSARFSLAVSIALVGTPLLAPPADAQVRVDLNWLFPVEMMYVSDFNPFSPGQQPDLLGILLQNGAAGSQNVVLELRVTMEQPQSLLVFRGTTDPFTLQEPVRRLTNRDLASTGQDVSIVDFAVGTQAEAMSERLAQTGRFPAGTYRFDVEVRTPQGVILDRGEIQRELTNPTRVELLAPGRPWGDPPPVLTSPSPRFIWSSDAGLVLGLGEYRIRVVPVEGAASPEEAMQGFAAWEEITTATSALYPGGSNALRLQPGATYAWQVVREVQTSGGVEELESPIYWFRMSGGAPGGTGTGSGIRQTVTRQLEQIGEQFGLGDELRDFQVTDPITLGDQVISLEDFQALLQAILDGDVPVGSIIVR